jgi:hypothetical protein
VGLKKGDCRSSLLNLFFQALDQLFEHMRL